MNERIEQLALQAEELDYETFDQYNHKTVKHYKFNKEKFAELIVQECAGICHKMAEDSDSYVVHDGDTCAEQIKKHFGVEE